MSYINDPRENIKNPENGYILEDDNRNEEMYNWSGKILDLCDLPVEEYMKPMTVIALGGGALPDTGETLYTLKFVIDGVIVYQDKLPSGAVINFDAVNGIKEGRNFLGWYYGGTKYEQGALMPSKSLTLTAKYNCNVSFIFVVDDIEEFISSGTVAYNSLVTNIPSTDKVGYEFLGWEPSVKNSVSAHTVFKGTFKSIVYIITWSGYTGETIIQEYKYGENIIQPENPKKEGYTFIKWDKEIPEKVSSNLTFNAIFEINKYQITYFEEYNGEKNQLSAFTMDYGTIIPKRPIPTEKGYSFSDWESEYKGTKVPAFNVEYITTKTINSYKLSYFVNGIGDNNAVNEVVYEYLAPIESYTFEKEGYYPVTSWDGLPTHMPYNDLKVYGTTEIMKFTVKFVDEEGILLKEEVVSYGTIIGEVFPVDTVEFEYSCEEGIKELVVKQDLTIDVVKTKKQYIVTFVNNGVEEKVSLEYGVNIKEYVTENYIPDEGYYLDYNTTDETVPGNNNARVEIIYKPNIWILSYATNGAGEKDINGEKEVAFGDSIMGNLPNTELEGFNFGGWFNGEQKITNDDTMPNNNVAVNGKYEVIMLHVNVLDGETIVLSKDYAYGTALSSVINESELVSYISELNNNGYNAVLKLNGEEIDNLMLIKTNLEIQIERIEKEYVLTFMNGENIISSALVKFNSIIEYPEMSGYTENGIEYIFMWEDDSYNGQSMPAKDLTIVGNYQEKAAAPIYYGSFVVPVSAYSEDNITAYISEDDIQGAYFQSVAVSDCVDAEKTLYFIYPAYTPFESLSGYKLNQEKNKYYEPLVLILPIDIIENYDITFKDGVIGSDCWADMQTDNKIMLINGNEYKAFAVAGDGYRPFKEEMIYEYKLLINKK